jgi:hypothetical protein
MCYVANLQNKTIYRGFSVGRYDAEIVFGDGVAVIKRRGISHSTVANVLGAESDPASRISRVWLDRVVHNTNDATLDGWHVSGAISTVLTRR